MTYITLKQRVELECGKREVSEIVELNLDNAKSSNIEGITSEFTSLEVLSMVNVGLQTLVGMPALPFLKNLELTNNLISGDLEALHGCPNLEQINLSNNKIETMEALVPIAKLSELQSLDLVNCPVVLTENYRKKTFAMVPTLKYLDGLDENNEEERDGDKFFYNSEELDGVDAVVSECDDDDEEEDGDDEIGIEALQQSGELDDDEEDYAPGEDDEAELDGYGDVDDDDEEDDDDEDEDNITDLSGAGEALIGVKRMNGKRRHEEQIENGDSKRKSIEVPEKLINNGPSIND